MDTAKIKKTMRTKFVVTTQNCFLNHVFVCVALVKCTYNILKSLTDSDSLIGALMPQQFCEVCLMSEYSADITKNSAKMKSLLAETLVEQHCHCSLLTI